jgi:hypothetical protein
MRILPCLLGAACLLAFPLDAAEAATFTTNSTADVAATGSTMDGVCDSDPTPAVVCTLRAAVQEANADTTAADVIQLPDLGPDYVLSLGGPAENAAAGGDLDIAGSLTIQGSGGTTINGAGIDRVLHVGPISGSPALSLIDVEIRGGGTEAEGGGVFVERGTIALDRVTIDANNAQAGAGSAAGGGLWIESPGTHSIWASTIAGNGATGGASALGAGVGMQHPSAALQVTNSTISDNTATSALGTARGGGLWTAGSATLTHATLHENSANGVPDGTGGNLYAQTTTVTLRASIVSDGDAGPGVQNCEGAFLSQGANVEGNAGGTGQCGLQGTLGDRMVTSAGVAPLADRGGPTQTHALLGGSLALDAVPVCYPLVTDQRGEGRPSAYACDSGSFERQVLPPRETCFGKPPTIWGFGAGESITGTPLADVILGEGGNDKINGMGGNDRICGDTGKDKLTGGAGNDKLAGESDNDKLYGKNGRDRLHGGGGRDVLNGGNGRDVLDGAGRKDKCAGGKKDVLRSC